MLVARPTGVYPAFSNKPLVSLTGKIPQRNTAENPAFMANKKTAPKQRANAARSLTKQAKEA